MLCCLVLLSAWHNLDSLGKREPQLSNFSDQVDLWPCLWGIILIDGQGRTQSTVGGPSLIVGSEPHKKISWTQPVSRQVCNVPLYFFCEFLPDYSQDCDLEVKPNKPFPPLSGFLSGCFSQQQKCKLEQMRILGFLFCFC